jgi:predicted aminopeptidase
MQLVVRWIGHFLNLGLLTGFLFLALEHRTVIYLFYQAEGQWQVLKNTSDFEDFLLKHKLSASQQDNFALIEKVKNYSVDSLDYEPTTNFTRIFDQEGQTTLWVVTACEPYSFDAYYWNFPLIGKVSYKGFFKKELAQVEYNHLVNSGYDVDMRGVSAWSTLGWFSDPLLSGMLDWSKGALCNLLFHELFHATYYAPGSVDLNENLANFVAHKATCRFLRNDTLALNNYLRAQKDRDLFDSFMLRQIDRLKKQYTKTKTLPDKYLLKLRSIFEVTDSLNKIPFHNKKRYLSRQADILKFKNAYFIDFIQYNSKQDSLEEVFNKIYGGKIENLVRYLKQN